MRSPGFAGGRGRAGLFSWSELKPTPTTPVPPEQQAARSGLLGVNSPVELNARQLHVLPSHAGPPGRAGLPPLLQPFGTWMLVKQNDVTHAVHSGKPFPSLASYKRFQTQMSHRCPAASSAWPVLGCRPCPPPCREPGGLLDGPSWKLSAKGLTAELPAGFEGGRRKAVVP